MKAEQISDLLKSIEQFRGLDPDGDPMHWNTAYHIEHIIDSAQKIRELLEEMKKCPASERLDLIGDVRDEVHHIKYHIEDSSYF